MNAEKWHHSEIRDKSQGSIAKNLRCDELLYYTFIIHSAGEVIFKIGEYLAKLRAYSLTVSYTPFALHFCPHKMQISPDKFFAATAFLCCGSCVQWVMGFFIWPM